LDLALSEDAESQVSDARCVQASSGEKRLARPADKPVGIFRAIGIAHRTTWRSPLFYVLVVGATQVLLVLLTIPVIRLLYQLVLVETGLGSIAYDRISQVLRNPLADIALLVIAVVAVIAILGEMVTLFVLASHHQDGEATALRLVLRQVWGTIKKLAHPQGLLMIVYLILLLPLGQLWIDVDLDKEGRSTPIRQRGAEQEPVHKPDLQRSSAGDHLPECLAPTIATDLLAPTASPWLAAVGLSAFQIGAFVITALLTIMIVQSLTAMLRDWLRRLSEDHRQTPAVISHSELSYVTARREHVLWGLAALVIAVAFTSTAVLNHQTMVNLVDSEQTQVLAHRGFIQGGVETTLPALQAAAKAGADRVEFDVMETKDGKFVVMHDTNLRRLTGKNLNVKDLTQVS
jgi:hypothetical protein